MPTAMPQDNDIHNYDYLTPEEYAELNFDASLVFICHREDWDTGLMVAKKLSELGLISSITGFCEMATDADLSYCLRAVSVRDLHDFHMEELVEDFRSIPFIHCDDAKLYIKRQDGSTSIVEPKRRN